MFPFKFTKTKTSKNFELKLKFNDNKESVFHLHAENIAHAVSIAAQVVYDNYGVIEATIKGE